GSFAAFRADDARLEIFAPHHLLFPKGFASCRRSRALRNLYAARGDWHWPCFTPSASDDKQTTTKSEPLKSPTVTHTERREPTHAEAHQRPASRRSRFHRFGRTRPDQHDRGPRHGRRPLGTLEQHQSRTRGRRLGLRLDQPDLLLPGLAVVQG